VKLWLNEHRFVEIGAEERASLSSELFPRSRSVDWMGIMGFLPDPDTVLEKLGEDMTIYRQLLADAHVWSCYQSRKSGLLACEWEIREPAAGGVRANRNAARLAAEVMAALDINQVICDMLEAVFFGISPIETIWGAEGTRWVPRALVGRPPEWFQFNERNELRFRSRENQIEGEAVPEYKILLARHQGSYQNPYGERILSRCFWPVAFKKGGLKFWTIFTEKYGMPFLVGRVPRGTNETERTRLLSALAGMVQDAVAVINDDESIELKESGGTVRGQIYGDLINVCNREISKAILGQTLSTELDQGGSYAATKGHLEIRQDLVDGDKKMVRSLFNLLLRWVTELNFAGAAAPEFAFFEEEDIQKERAERDEILTRQGLRFTPDYYRRVYNLEQGDFELGLPPAPARGGSGPGFARKVPEPPPGSADETPGDLLDALGRRMLREADFGPLTGPIEALLRRARSLEEFRDGLLDLYPDLDEAGLGAMMQKAFTVAELSGRFDARRV